MANICSNSVTVNFKQSLTQLDLQFFSNEKTVFSKIQEFLKKNEEFKSENEMKEDWFFISEMCDGIQSYDEGDDDFSFYFDSKWAPYNKMFIEMLKLFGWKSLTNEYHESGCELAGIYSATEFKESNRVVDYHEIFVSKDMLSIYYCDNHEGLDFMKDIIGNPDALFFDTSKKSDLKKLNRYRILEKLSCRQA